MNIATKVVITELRRTDNDVLTFGNLQRETVSTLHSFIPDGHTAISKKASRMILKNAILGVSTLRQYKTQE